MKIGFENWFIEEIKIEWKRVNFSLKLSFFSPLLISKGVQLLLGAKWWLFQKKIVNDRIFTQQNRLIYCCCIITDAKFKENTICCYPYLFGI